MIRCGQCGSEDITKISMKGRDHSYKGKPVVFPTDYKVRICCKCNNLILSNLDIKRINNVLQKQAGVVRCTRYCTVKDDDGHTFLIPHSMREDFLKMLEVATEKDDYADFCAKYDCRRIDGAHNLTFTDPRDAEGNTLV